MLIEIDRIDFKLKNPVEIDISNILKNKIKNNWDLFIKDKKDYWDGDIYTITKVDLKSYILEVGKCKYSNLIYAKQNKDLTIRSLFSSILLKTKDSKYLIVKNNQNYLNIIGGLANKTDFYNNNEFSPDLCIRREVLEEIGIDLCNLKQVLNYQMKYLKIPENNENYYPIGILYVGELNYTSEEFNRYIKDKKFDNEIKEYYYYNKEECMKLELTDPDNSYVKELILLENK